MSHWFHLASPDGVLILPYLSLPSSASRVLASALQHFLFASFVFLVVFLSTLTVVVFIFPQDTSMSNNN